MNRRSFVERLALGAASFMILPGAGRVWRAMRDVPNGPPFIVSEWLPPTRVLDGWVEYEIESSCGYRSPIQTTIRAFVDVFEKEELEKGNA